MLTLIFRDSLRPQDVQAIKNIVTDTGFFEPSEIITAQELALDNLSRGEEASGYSFILAEHEGQVIGYTCYGLIIGSEHHFDLYWIAVFPEYQNQKIGKQLLQKTEEKVKQIGGTRIYAETSGHPSYLSTREFYRKNGYHVEAVLVDYFKPGHDKVIFAKDLT